MKKCLKMKCVTEKEEMRFAVCISGPRNRLERNTILSLLSLVPIGWRLGRMSMFSVLTDDRS